MANANPDSLKLEMICQANVNSFFRTTKPCKTLQEPQILKERPNLHLQQQQNLVGNHTQKVDNHCRKRSRYSIIILD